MQPVMRPRYGIRFPVWLLAAVCLCCAAGCSKKVMELAVVGDADMNAGNGVVLRVYQLSGDAKFRNTTLASFWENDEQALAGELLPGGKQELFLFPNETRPIPLNLTKETRFVGIAADFREPDAEQWRVLYPAGELKGKKVTVRVQENRLAVSIQ
jgi:type VI secretion system VasD/TssJ family lipoprotein